MDECLSILQTFKVAINCFPYKRICIYNGRDIKLHLPTERGGGGKEAAALEEWCSTDSYCLLTTTKYMEKFHSQLD